MFEITHFKLQPTTRAAVLRMQKACGDGRGLDAVIEEAMQAWLQNASCKAPQAAQAAARGYQWKSLFLPEGSCVRFRYKGQFHEAAVRGNELIYLGKAYSPRQWLLFVTGTVRNAWRELWLRSPGDARWHLADTRRHILRRTPQDRHPRGVDLAPLHPHQHPHQHPRTAGQHAMTVPPRQEQAAGSAPAQRFPANPWRAAQLRAILYRDDLVRPDQPDLANKLGGGGPCRAGRAGPRDRRYISVLFETGQR